jgi:hypothetical protein
VFQLLSVYLDLVVISEVAEKILESTLSCIHLVIHDSSSRACPFTI